MKTCLDSVEDKVNRQYPLSNLQELEATIKI